MGLAHHAEQRLAVRSVCDLSWRQPVPAARRQERDVPAGRHVLDADRQRDAFEFLWEVFQQYHGDPVRLCQFFGLLVA